MRKNILISIVSLTLICSIAKADFNDGVVFYTMGDYEKAFSTMKSLAEVSEHAYAQYYLGMMYMKGQGLQQDYKTASYWFRKAAEKGIPQAQYKLGDLYYKGRGVPKDYEFSYVWFSVGASHKHKLSINSINKAKEKLSKEELKEADKLIATYIKNYGPKKDSSEKEQTANMTTRK